MGFCIFLVSVCILAYFYSRVVDRVGSCNGVVLSWVDFGMGI